MFEIYSSYVKDDLFLPYRPDALLPNIPSTVSRDAVLALVKSIVADSQAYPEKIVGTLTYNDVVGVWCPADNVSLSADEKQGLQHLWFGLIIRDFGLHAVEELYNLKGKREWEELGFQEFYFNAHHMTQMLSADIAQLEGRFKLMVSQHRYTKHSRWVQKAYLFLVHRQLSRMMNDLDAWNKRTDTQKYVHIDEIYGQYRDLLARMMLPSLHLAEGKSSRVLSPLFSTPMWAGVSMAFLTAAITCAVLGITTGDVSSFSWLANMPIKAWLLIGGVGVGSGVFTGLLTFFYLKFTSDPSTLKFTWAHFPKPQLLSHQGMPMKPAIISMRNIPANHLHPAAPPTSSNTSPGPNDLSSAI